MSLEVSLIGLGVSLAFIAAGDLRTLSPLGLFGLALAAAALAGHYGVRLF